MSNTPHELIDDFPELADQISNLRQSNAHFEGLAEQYHVLNRQIHRVETNIEPMDDFGITSLRKERMLLKDQLYQMLTAQEA